MSCTGEILLDLDKAEEAVEMFETSLLRMAGRPRSLLGLARAQAALGNDMLAAEAYGKVAALWEGRTGIAGLDEARGFVEEHAGGSRKLQRAVGVEGFSGNGGTGRKPPGGTYACAVSATCAIASSFSFTSVSISSLGT